MLSLFWFYTMPVLKLFEQKKRVAFIGCSLFVLKTFYLFFWPVTCFVWFAVIRVTTLVLYPII